MSYKSCFSAEDVYQKNMCWLLVHLKHYLIGFSFIPYWCTSLSWDNLTIRRIKCQEIKNSCNTIRKGGALFIFNTFSITARKMITSLLFCLLKLAVVRKYNEIFCIVFLYL